MNIHIHIQVGSIEFYYLALNKKPTPMHTEHPYTFESQRTVS